MSSNPPNERPSSGERHDRRGEVPYDPTHLLAPPRTALRGRPRGREMTSGAPQTYPLATFLGWFSVGLGALELLAPSVVARAIGVRPTPVWSGLLQLFGLRELATGAGILRNPSSKEWVGLRVGGDALDLVTLGVALTQSVQPARTLAAMGVVLGATMLDIVGAERLAERRKLPARGCAPGEPVVLRSITVGRPVGEVYEFWNDFANFPRFMQHVQSIEVLDDKRSRWLATGPAGTRAEWVAEIVERRANELIAWQTVEEPTLYHTGKVTFQAAPRDEGTVVTVEMRYAPPGGPLGAALLKLFRKEPGQQVGDDLRRFKQVMEIGEVLHSDASAAPGVAAARPHEKRSERTVH
jgi:uncharacterized membrane protein